MRWRWVLLTICLLILVSAAGQKTRQQIDLERIAAADPRIEVVARALARSQGLDPDHEAFPYPGPLWERYVLEARDYLTERDAVDEWIKRRTGTTGTTAPKE